MGHDYRNTSTQVKRPAIGQLVVYARCIDCFVRSPNSELPFVWKVIESKVHYITLHHPCGKMFHIGLNPELDHPPEFDNPVIIHEI
jgi:hypothetical protein